MIRRFDDYQIEIEKLQKPELFMEKSVYTPITIQTAPAGVQQAWQVIYQLAWAHAVAQAIQAARPTRYQRLLYNVCLN
jgi:hypothetical protein